VIKLKVANLKQINNQLMVDILCKKEPPTTLLMTS